MADHLRITVDGEVLRIQPGTSVAVAILNSGRVGFRLDLTGSPRGPVCGMGICFECRVRIDSERDRRSCQILCRDGMVIETRHA